VTVSVGLDDREKEESEDNRGPTGRPESPSIPPMAPLTGPPHRSPPDDGVRSYKSTKRQDGATVICLSRFPVPGVGGRRQQTPLFAEVADTADLTAPNLC
jgi:hypothetical protein